MAWEIAILNDSEALSGKLPVANLSKATALSAVYVALDEGEPSQ